MDLVAIARAAIAACHPGPRCERAIADLDLDLEGSVLVVGAGKAAVAMAEGVTRGLAARGLRAEGLVVTKDGHARGFAPEGIEIRFAGHPEPDGRSAAAGRALVGRLRLSHCHRVVAVVSGGASSLIAAPIAPITVAELAETTRVLLESGLDIHEMNALRKAITLAGGGGLARAARAPVDVFVVSDVVGNDLAVVGSGPFFIESSPREPLAIPDGIPESVRAVIAGATVAPEGTPRVTPRVAHHLVASPETLLEAAVAEASARGLRPRRLEPATGDIVSVAERLAAEPLEPGEIVVGIGEPTVTLPPDHGLGGRNQALALEMAHRIADGGRVFLSLGSDGGDGPTDAAGAIVDGGSLARLRASGDVEAARRRFDAHPLLDRAGLLVRTGPTDTNVLDLHLFARREP